MQRVGGRNVARPEAAPIQRDRTMKRTIIAAACVLLAGPALAQSLGEKTGVNSALGVAPATADFVKEVAISDMFEIESSKLAEQKGNAQEKTFAQQMVTDHTKTSSELKGLVSGGKVQATLPTALDSSHQSKLDKLKSANGKDFSSDYNSYQVSAHEDAVSLFERYAKGGDNSDLKDWAGKTLPALKHHLDMAKELGKAPSVGQTK
jgi:putative membrane protein